MQNTSPRKKMLENTFLSGLMVPIAIVLVGILIVFGVTKMLSTERTHRDLVNDLHSKTFGNRGVAAFELSKLIASKKIPKKEYPWLIENLSKVFRDAKDSKTRSFIVVALGALKDASTIGILENALFDPDKEVQFQAVAALGNIPKGSLLNSIKIIEKLQSSKDSGVKQGLIYVLATHNVIGAQTVFVEKLNDSDMIVRFAAATALIKYKNQLALPVLEEILFSEKLNLNDKARYDLKINIFNTLKKQKWLEATALIQKYLKVERNEKLQIAAREVLIFQKNDSD